MKAQFRNILLASMMLGLVACTATNSKQQILAAGSQVEIRSYQTRTYDTNNKIRVLRAVMSTLQDLGFVIDKADDVIGIVSATKLQGYALSMSISVRPKGQQMVVRANAQYNLRAVEDPGPYQNFFTSLDKGLFLDDNLLTDSVVVHVVTAESSTAAAVTPDPGVYAFYGEAEMEISSDSYDPDLWARAFVLVEGDEQKRKAKYIELRGAQLYEQDVASRSQSGQVQQAVVGIQPVPAEQPVSDTDVSGTYTCEITGIGAAQFRRITLQQRGVNVTGSWDNNPDNRIIGTLEDDTITFVWLEPVTGHEKEGIWKINADGSGMTGRWSRADGRNNGKFNLTKIH